MRCARSVALLLVAAVALAASVTVNVMLPLDTITSNMQINDPDQLSANLKSLASIGVDGVNIDVWWGLVEQAGPKQYNWQPYIQLVNLIRPTGLKMQAVMSFHQCGGNVGDQCDILLPPWVTNVTEAFYTDREGNVDYEYISLGADLEPLFEGRTPVQIYHDYMQSFADNVLANGKDVINQIEVSLGPAGEMRYPSYRFNAYPGVGEFQCYDKYLLAQLKQAAQSVGHPEWGNGGPDNAGTYHDQPQNTGFWSDGTTDNYASDYGKFFLSWYSNALIAHGDRVLAQAQRVFGSYVAQGVLDIAAKISGIHWLYKTDSHAAECTGGYYNTNQNNAYEPIAKMFASHNVTYDFTAFEMFDSDQCSTCAPQELVLQNHLAADKYGVRFAGENALNCYDQRHYSQIEYQSGNPTLIFAFAYLRLDDTLMQSNNFNLFAKFVYDMHHLP